MTFPCSKRAICFFVMRNSAPMAVTAIAGCASRLSQSLFIFRIGQRVWPQRAYTISMRRPRPLEKKARQREPAGLDSPDSQSFSERLATVAHFFVAHLGTLNAGCSA